MKRAKINKPFDGEARLCRALIGLFFIFYFSLAASSAADRTIKASDITISRGQTNSLIVWMQIHNQTAGHEENAVGFTLRFDTNLVRYVSSALIGEGSAGQILRTTSQLNSHGRIGLSVALSPGEFFLPGSNSLFEVRFRALDGSGNALTNIEFYSNPIAQQVGDVEANEIDAATTEWINSTLTILGTCSYALSTNSALVAAGVNSGSVNVIAGTGCDWTAATTNDWIIITSGASGSGNGTIAYDVAANTAFIARTGIVTVADQSAALVATYTIVQAEAGCNYSLSRTNRNHGHGATMGSNDIITAVGCEWTVENTNDWIHISSATNGSGPFTVTYNVDANTTINPRVATLLLAGLPFTVNQSGIPCTYDFSPSQRTNGHGTGSGAVNFDTVAGCDWTISNTNPWVCITSISNEFGVHPSGCSGTNGIGSGSFNYSIDANTNALDRNAIIVISGQNGSNAVFTLTQRGVPCELSTSPTSRNVGYAGISTNFTVRMTSGCAWTAATPNEWITLTGTTNGSENAAVSYTVAPNTNSISRTGTIVIAGSSTQVVYTVTQDALVCTYSLATASRRHGPGTNNNTVIVTATAGCAWSLDNTNAWISLVTSNGIGIGARQTNFYGLHVNPFGLERVGHIAVRDYQDMIVTSMIITQQAATCNYSISPTNTTRGHVATNNDISINTLTGCVWTVSNTNDWVTITPTNGSGPGSVNWSIPNNPFPVDRTAIIFIQGRQFTLTQRAAPCNASISPTTTNVPASGLATGLVEITIDTNCTWTISNSNSWVHINSATNGTNNASVSYSVDTNPDFVARVGFLTIANESFRITQAGQPCTFVLDPTSASHTYNSETGSVSITTSNGCVWNVSDTNTWISFLPPTSGTNDGTVTYTVQANTNTFPRTGTFTIGGETFIVTQAAGPCSYKLSDTDRLHGQGANSNNVLLTTGTNCEWIVINTNTWLRITSETNGTGTVTIAYAFDANTVAIQRSGAVTVHDPSLTVQAVLTIAQRGAPCTFDLFFTDRTHGHSGTTSATNELTGVIGCDWTIANSNSWIELVNTNGSGSADIVYRVLANSETFWRTGVVAVLNESNAVVASFTINQRPAPCSYTLNPSNALHQSAAQAATFEIATSTNCDWTVSETNTWITVTLATNGTANGTVSYELEANPNGGSRTGFIFVNDPTGAGDRAVFRITQLGLPCSFELSHTTASHDGGAHTGTVAVTTITGCAWTAVESNSWITIASGNSGNSNGVITYVVDENPSAMSRVGVITLLYSNAPVAQLEITQSAADCTYRVSPLSRSHGHRAITNDVTVTTLAGCSWTADTTNDWIVFLSDTNSTGNITQDVRYAVVDNPAAFERIGAITIADLSNVIGASLVITQRAAPCTFDLSFTDRTHGHAGTMSATNELTSVVGCDWTIANTNSWIQLAPTNGSGTAEIIYRVDANALTFWRTGVVAVLNESNTVAASFTINQRPAPCAYTLLPPAPTHGSAAETGSFDIGTSANCHWNVDETNTWISITSVTNGTGNATVTYQLEANPTGAIRTGFITVSDPTGVGDPEAIRITQSGVVCTFSLSSTNPLHPGVDDTGTVAVTSITGCSWRTTETNDWISIVAGTGSGDGVITYVIEANPTALPRTGLVTLLYSNAPVNEFYVTQAGAECTYRVSPTNRPHGHGITNGSFSVITLEGCSWTAATTNDWISILVGTNATGTGNVSYAISENPTAYERFGSITIQDQTTSAAAVLTITQRGAPCTFELSPTNRTHGYAATNGTVDLITITGCSWTLDETNDWITITSATNGTGGATIDYSIESNPLTFWRTGVVSVIDASNNVAAILTINQRPAPCAFAASPSNPVHSSGAVTAAVEVATSSNCDWSVENTNSWITILPPTNGTGNGTFSYELAANTVGTARTGFITVGAPDIDRAVIQVTQAGAPCTFAFAPSNALHVASQTNGSVDIITIAGCSWSVTETNDWISIVSGNSGTGDGTLNYNIDANPTGLSRTGFLTLQYSNTPVLHFSITQAGATCTFEVSPTTAAHDDDGATNTFTVNTLLGCNWTARTTNDWISFESGAIGTRAVSQVVTYIVAENPTAFERIGEIRAGNTQTWATLIITQQAATCTFSISPASVTHDHVATDDMVSVTSPTGCDWTVFNANDWIEIVSGTNGSGNGTVTYSVAENSVTLWRTGVVMIAGEQFTVVQRPAPCTFGLSASNAVHTHGFQVGSFSIATSTNCAWIASVPSSNGWISITSGTNGIGDGVLDYELAPNSTGMPRTGAIHISGETTNLFRITQSGVACNFSFSPTGAVHTALEQTATVNVVTITGCAWAITETNDWISITSASSGTGGGPVSYRLEANPSSLARTGVLVLQHSNSPVARFLITQAGAACSYSVNPSNPFHLYRADTGVVSVTAIEDCLWSAVATNTWVTITSGSNGVGGGILQYTVEENPDVTARSAVVAILDQTSNTVAICTITQEGAPCTFDLSHTSTNFSYGANTGVVEVTTRGDCTWPVLNTNGWIVVTSGESYTNSATVTYTVAQNPTALIRTGQIIIDGQIFSVTQQAAPCTFSLSETNQVHPYLAQTSSITVTTLVACAWTVENTNAWITILAPTNGAVGSGVIDYSVSANLTTNGRSAVLTISGDGGNVLLFIVAQEPAPCLYSLTESNHLHGFDAETGTIDLIAIAGCTWQAETTNDWIAVIDTAGVGSATIRYALNGNSTALPRTGLITIEGEEFLVTQAAAPCAFELSSNNAVHTSLVGTGSFNVLTLTGCVWSVSTATPWIQILSSLQNSNTGTVDYSIEVNPTALARSGQINISGQGGATLTFAVTQTGAACTFTLSASNATHSSVAQSNSFAVNTLTGCVWSVSTATPWIQIASSLSNSNTSTVDYSVEANPTALTRSGAVIISGQGGSTLMFEVAQTGAACTFALTSSNATHSSVAQSNAFGVNTLTGCVWSVSTATPWIQILSSGNSNAGTVNYSVETNPTALTRSGTIVVDGQGGNTLIFDVTQTGAACTFALSANNATHSSVAQSNSFGLNTLTGCVWSVSTPTPWIQILSSGNSNSGTVNYSIEANPTALTRNGSIIISGQGGSTLTFDVTQTGAACTFALSTNSATHNSVAQSNSFGVTTLTGCVWSASTLTPWIQILSSGNSNSGTVNYSIETNPTALTRTGSISISGQGGSTLIFNVTQTGAACTFALSTNNATHISVAQSNSFGVTTLTGCVWAVSTPTPWIHILSSGNSNSGTVSYSVEANPTALTRNGSITVSGQGDNILTFNVTQTGAACTFALSTNNATHSSVADTNSFGVTTLTGCVWSVSSPTPWIRILSSLSNSNSDTVRYSVEANPTALTRTGTISISGQGGSTLIFDVTQTAAPCTFTLSTNNATHSPLLQTNSFGVTTLTGCTWSVTTTSAWIRVLSSLSNSNSGSVTYSVENNPTALTRSGVITISGQGGNILEFAVTQVGAACTFFLSSSNRTHPSSLVETTTFNVTTLTGCTWSVSASASWINIHSSLVNSNSGAVSYSVQTNPTALARSGVITISGQGGNTLTYDVTQTGASCSYALSHSNASHIASATNGQFTVITLTGCVWTVVNTNTWISLPASGSDTTLLNYLLEANNGLERTGTVVIAGAGGTPQMPFTIAQAAGVTYIYPSPLALTRSLTNCFSVSMNALGNENAVGFSFCFDTNLVRYVSARDVNDGAPGFLNVRTNRLAQGEIGFGLALPAGEVFAAGSNNILQICFRAMPGSGPTSTVLSVCSSPLRPEVSDVDANEIPGIFADVPVTIQPLCIYALSSNSASFTAAGGSGSVTLLVDVGCPWTIDNPNTWITVNSTNSGSGTSVVSFAVSPNALPSGRTGVITIGGQTFTVSQAGIICAYNIAPTTTNHNYLSVTGQISVTTSNVCSWTASTTNQWITIVNPSNAVVGNGAISYVVASNPTAIARSGFITLLGQADGGPAPASRVFSVTQVGAPCSFNLSPPSASHPYNALTGTVAISTLQGCSWTVTNTPAGAGWLTFSPAGGIGAGAPQIITYVLTENPTTNARNAALTFTGQGGTNLTFAINQAGAPCGYVFTPTFHSNSFGAANRSFALSTGPACPWTARTSNSWITLLTPSLQPAASNQLSGVGPATINYSVAQHQSGIGRTGTIAVANGAASVLFTVIQDAVQCNYSIAPRTNFHAWNAVTQTNSVGVATFDDCPWNVTNTNAWIIILAVNGQSPTNRVSSSGTFTYLVTSNLTANARTGIVMVADERLTVIQGGAPCDFAFSGAAEASHGPSPETGSVAVNTVSGCPWTVGNTNPWVFITSSSSFNGGGTFTYRITNNPVGLPRTAVLTIQNSNNTVLQFTIRQASASCTFVFNPTSRSHDHRPTNSTMPLASLTGCPWTLENTNDWISITSNTSGPIPTNGSGSATISYTVTNNPTAFPRTGVVTLLYSNTPAAQFTVNQSGAPCTLSVSPATQPHGFAATNGTVSVNSIPGCNWTASVPATNAWITINSGGSGSGNGTIAYNITTNPTALSRSGIITVNGAGTNVIYTITQSGSPCTASLSPTNATGAGQTHGPAHATGVVSIATLVGCTWTVQNTNSWITISTPTNSPPGPGTNGTGPTNIVYTVEANASPSQRSGVIRVNVGGTILPFTVTQIGITCTYALGFSNKLHEAVDTNGASILVPIITGDLCPWEIINTNAWIIIKTTNFGVGPTNMRYNVVINEDPTARSGVVLFGGIEYHVTQLGQPCRFTIVPPDHLHGSGAETGRVNISTSPQCTWTVRNTNDWIILSATNGLGPGTLDYTLRINSTAVDRVGTFTLEDGVEPATYTITQLGAGCTYSLTPVSRSRSHTFNAETGIVGVDTFAGCPWPIIETNTWITITLVQGQTPTSNPPQGIGPGSFTYSLASNNTAIPRTGVISVVGENFTVTQAGAPCSFLLSTNSRAHGSTIENGTIGVTTPTGCTWGLTNTNSWILITSGLQGTNNGLITYTVGQNQSSIGRTGVVVFAGQGGINIPITLTQAGGPCNYTLNPSNALHTFNVSTGSFTASSLTGCVYTVFNTNTWVQILSGASGTITAPQTVIYRLDQNSGALPRSGLLFVNGQRFTITQAQMPFVCAPDKTVECGTSWNFDAPTPSGVCTGGPAPTITILTTVTNAGACPNTIVATRTWEAVDACSNRITCSQTVRLVDTTGPQLTCPGNKTVECGTAWTFDTPTAFDACQGSGSNLVVRVLNTATNIMCGNTMVATRTWEAIDACSNRVTCSQIVTVRDTTPPALTCASAKTAEFGSGWSFDSPVATDNCDGSGVSIRVVSTVTNATGLCTGGYTVTRTWEAADACSNRITCAQIVTLRDTTPPTLTCVANKIVTCGSWSFDGPSASDLADGTNVIITILSTVTNGACPGVFTATRTWQAEDTCGNRSTCSQTVMNSQTTVSGSILYYPNSREVVSAATLTVEGGTNLITQTGADGSFSFTLNPGGDYVITPTAPPSDPDKVSLGVSTVDISRIRQHVLNPLARLDSPYKLLAADVSINGSVTTADIAHMRRLILGATSTLPSGLWRFVPSDHVFANPDAPWDAPSNRVYTALPGTLTGQNFHAIKMGDVNVNWTNAVPPGGGGGTQSVGQNSAQAAMASPAPSPESDFTVSFKPSCHTNEPSETVTVEVLVRNFSRVTSVQFTLDWDTNALIYRSLVFQPATNYLPGLNSGNFGVLPALVSSGMLTFSWDDPNGVTLRDGAAIFGVVFDVASTARGRAPILLTDAVTPREVAINFETAGFDAEEGFVDVLTTEPPTLDPSTITYQPSANFSIAVQTQPGKRYTLEFTDTLSTPNWQPVGPVAQEGDGSLITLSDPAPHIEQRFYRVRIE